MWIFSLQFYRAMSSFTVKAFAAYFTSSHQLNNEKVSNPPGRCYLASGSKGSPEKILTIWIVREKVSRAVFELFIRPEICDLEAAPLESPAAPPNSQGSHLSGHQQIFYISKDGNISKNTEEPAHWAVLRIIAEMGAFYHSTSWLATFHRGLDSTWVNMFLTSHSMYAITDLLDEYFMLKNWAVWDGLPPKYELSWTRTLWVRTAIHCCWA